MTLDATHRITSVRLCVRTEMAKYKTEFAVKQIVKALANNKSMHTIKASLLAAGFSAEKSAIIIRWAQQHIINWRNDEKDSGTV